MRKIYDVPLENSLKKRCIPRILMHFLSRAIGNKLKLRYSVELATVN